MNIRKSFVLSYMENKFDIQCSQQDRFKYNKKRQKIKMQQIETEHTVGIFHGHGYQMRKMS